ncbi:MAG: NAD(P)/FAD-dependent oxidoreductase [Clostridia bacterium]|nr:NAD(P)/FAD-dependent oxidoreductase [Clostridia bacterium]
MKIAVIGGGAAGLMAAATAAREGADVTLFEKNEKLGKKIYITGKGRCNFTNRCSEEEFLANVVNNGRFLSGAISRFTPDDCIRFFESEGMPVKIERGNRAFPASDHASDVTKTLERVLEKYRVNIVLNRQVIKIKPNRRPHTAARIRYMSKARQTMAEEYLAIPQFFEVTSCKVQHLDSAYPIVLPAIQTEVYDKVIIATGGLTYPSTGSTGDGYVFAQQEGHTVNECRPALCGLNTRPDFEELQGLSLRNVQLHMYLDFNHVGSYFGEMLFTHYGISGPIVLSVSSRICHLNMSRVHLMLDFKPAITDAELGQKVLKLFSENQNKDVFNCLKDLMPHELMRYIIKRAGVPLDKKVNVVTRDERQAIVKLLKHFDILLDGVRGWDEAIITSGGISVKEINPKTFESKCCDGMYFCGEVLDVDALTGGFNLQTAFSTGYCAGKAAAGGTL